MSEPVDAFIGVGANLGDARHAVEQGIAALGEEAGIELLASSRLYRTPAWGVTDQPDFVNAVAQVRTVLAPRTLLERLLAIEHRAGRDRSAGLRWGPRVLDLDLLVYGQLILDEPGLHVPHPRLHERAFALVPLHELAPMMDVPGRGPLAVLRAAMESADIEALG